MRRIPAALLVATIVAATLSSPAKGQDWAVRELRVHGRTMKAWADDLKDADPEVRWDAAKALAQFAEHSRAATPFLLAAARDSDPRVRAEAMSAQLPKTDDVEKLIVELVQDPDISVRFSAHHLAHRLADDQPPHTLSAAFYEDDEKIRQLAIHSIWFRFRRHQLQQRPRSRENLEPFGEFVPAMVYAYTRSKDDGVRGAMLKHLLTTMSTRSIPLLHKAATSSHATVRRRALELLLEVAAGNDREFLDRFALNDCDPKVRSLALNHVTSISRWEDFVFPAILEGIADPDRHVREAATLGLSELRPTHGIDVARILDLTCRSNDAIRAAAATALGNFAATDDEALAALIHLLKDPSPDVRVNCCNALANLESGNSSAFRALLGALEDPVAAVRVMARRAISKVAWPSLDPKLTDKAVETVVRLLNPDQFAEASLVASHSFQRLDPDGKRILPHFVDWIVMNPDQVDPSHMAALRNYGKPGEEAFERCAQSRITPIAKAAILTLDTADPKHRDLLLSALKADCVERKIAALTCLDNSHRELEASVAREVANCLRNDHVEIRAAAAKLLSRCPPSPAVFRALEAGLNDPDPNVLQQTLRTLQRFPQLPPVILETLGRLARLDNDNAPMAFDFVSASGPRSAAGVNVALARIAQDHDSRLLFFTLHRLHFFEIRRDELAMAVADRLQRETENPSDEIDVPSSLIGALGQLGPAADNSIPILMHYACDGRKGLRLAAVSALGQIGPNAAAAVPLLQARLEDDEPELAEAACVALGKIVTP
jgi:HEAT repeat protein